MISTLELVKGVINSHHGWAVADQFEDSYNGQSFEEQNYNALQYIHETLQELVEDSDVLSDSALDDLKTYLDNLGIYLDELKTYLAENS